MNILPIVVFIARAAPICMGTRISLAKILAPTGVAVRVADPDKFARTDDADFEKPVKFQLPEDHDARIAFRERQIGKAPRVSGARGNEDDIDSRLAERAANLQITSAGGCVAKLKTVIQTGSEQTVTANCVS